MIWDSLREAFGMLWETLWALVLGFGLSGIVQSFVSRADLQRTMGDHRPRTIVRTSLWGAASSSCSYAASALAKSLFQRGADWTASVVFMFASTNLVVELGIVLWLLMGWQFALAEVVGGVVMIALFALLAPRVFPVALVEEARARLEPQAPAAVVADSPLRQRLRERDGWLAAAAYTISDLRMVRRELVIGFLVAGVIAVAVPTSVFTALFIPGHGLLTAVENALLGPVIACVSFVCSIGNVPLAAALYDGGISFGGTIAFIFGDLVALPLVVIFAKLYGRRLATRLVLALWAVMAVAGLLVEGLFRALSIDAPHRRAEVAPTDVRWDHTTWLDLVALAVLVVIVAAWRRRDQETSAYATDPVCGMQVEKAHPGATLGDEFFCCEGCRDRRARELELSGT